MNSSANIRLGLFVGLLLTILLPLQAQQNNSLYFMQGLPQSSQLNPATQPKCGFSLSLFSVEIGAGNSALGFNDFLIYDSKVDSLFWFLHNNSTRSNFLDKIKSNINAFGEARIDLPSLGFRINKTYVTLGAGIRVVSNNYLPSDLIKFGVEGNVDTISGNLRSYDFSGVGVNTTTYDEFSLGISHEINDKWTVGIRGKLLFGIANVTTNSSTVQMEGVGHTDYMLRSLATINTSVPNLRVITGADGKVDSLKFDDVKSSQIRTIMMNPKNMGLGVDLGVIFKPIDKLSLSLSVLDLGYIKWKDNLNTFKQDASFDFKGVNLPKNDSTNAMNAFLDTLKNNFTYSTGNSGYKTSLNPKIYAGVLYQLTKRIGLGALTRQEIINSKLNSQYTFSLNLYPANALNFTFSYTIADKMYDNFGAGLAFKLGFLQAYFMTERFPLYWYSTKQGYPIPQHAKSVNLRFGFNIVLGYRHREKKQNADKPLVDL